MVNPTVLRPFSCAVLAYGFTAFFDLGMLTLSYMVAAVYASLFFNGVSRRIAWIYMLFIAVSTLAPLFAEKLWFYYIPLCASVVAIAMVFLFVTRPYSQNSKSKFIYKLLTFDIVINILATIEFGTTYDFIYTIYPIAAHFVHLMILSEILRGEVGHGLQISIRNICLDLFRWFSGTGKNDLEMEQG